MNYQTKRINIFIMKSLTSLEQRVHGKNFLNEQRLIVLKKIEEEFKSLEGAKVQLATGDHSKKWTLKSDLVKTYKTINNTKVFLSYQYFFDFSHSFVQLRSKVCISGGSYDVRPATAFCQYIENTDYIGQLESQILKESDSINGCIENATQETENPIDLKKFEEQKKQYTEALAKVNQIKDEVNYNLRDFLPKY